MMRIAKRALCAFGLTATLALSGCGYLDDGGSVNVVTTSKSVSLSGTVVDPSASGGATKLSQSAFAKANAKNGCADDVFTITVGDETVCSVHVGGGIHEYQITANVAGDADKVVVNFRRSGLPPGSQLVVLGEDGTAVAPTFEPREYDSSETVDETTTFTVEADSSADDDNEPDAIVEISANTTQGDVKINILVVDPSDEEDSAQLPGEQADADEQELQQLAAVEITLSDEDGEEVQPAEDKPITVTLNLPPAAANGIRNLIAAGAEPEGLTVGWRSYDEEKETWVEEDADPSTPGVQGARVLYEDDEPVSVRALISHLTWYAAGEVIPPADQGCTAVSVTDADGNPLDDILVKLNVEGEPFGDKAITDSSGIAYLNSLVSSDDTPRTITLSAIRDGATVARLTGQAAPTTGGVTADTPDLCDKGATLSINVEGSVVGTVVRGVERNPASGIAVFIESTDDGIDGLARATTNASGAFEFIVPTPFNFEVFAGGDSNTGTIAAAAVTADAGELFIGNAAPTSAEIDAAATITVPEGSIALSASGVDPDGDTLSFSWTTTDGTFDVASGESVSWTAPASPSGTATITLTATDGELSTTATIELSWDEVNVAPTISGVSSSVPGNVPNSGTATITVDASDANSEDTLTFVWSTSVGSIGSGAAAVEFTAPASGFGTATITVEVSDGEFTATESFSQGFGTPPNQPPSIDSISRAPLGDVGRGDTVGFTASASDPDSSPNPLTYAWSATGGSFSGATDATTAQWVAPISTGSFTITLTVSDGEGSASESLVVNVVNTAPSVSVTADPSGDVQRNTTVAFQVDATDAEGDELTYSWSANIGSFTGDTSGTFVNWTAPDASGSAIVTVVVSDGDLSTTETIDFAVLNQAPSITEVTASSSGDIAKEAVVALSATVNDADGDASFSWTASDGSFNGATDTDTAEWVAPATPGAYTVTLTITDGEFTDSETLNFTVTNAAPVISSATSTPADELPKNTTAAVEVVATDSDGDDLVISWSASAGSFTGATDQATAEWLAPDEAVEAELTVTVSDGFETTSEIISLSVIDRAPVIEAIIRTPSGDVSKGEVVTLEADVFDPDGDAITYEWTSGFGFFTGATDQATVTWDAPFEPGSYDINLSVSDGNTLVGEIVTVVVTNAAPVALDDSATTGVDESVTISVLANDSDADGDLLTIDAITVAPANGTATTDGITVDYVPDAGFTGTDTFTYLISDTFETDTAEVTVTVVEAPDAAFGDFNAVSWGGSLESDSRFGNNKRLGQYSSIFGLSFFDQGSGDVLIDISAFGYEYYMEYNHSDGFGSVEGEGEEDGFPGQLQGKAIDGAIYIQTRLEDDSETEYASVEFNDVIRMLPGGDNAYLGAEFYRQLSSLRPVVSDNGLALNTEQVLDDDFEPALQLFTRRAESFDGTELNGDYGVVTQRITLNENGDREIQGHVTTVPLTDGAGSSTSLTVSSIERQGGSMSSSFGYQEVLAAGESISYNLAPPAADLTGRVEGEWQAHYSDGSSDPALILDGFSTPDGGLFTVVSPNYEADKVQLSLHRGVRLGSGLTEDDLIGKTYMLTRSTTSLDNGSGHEISTESGVRVLFESAGSLRYICGAETVGYYASRNADGAAPEGETEISADDAGGDCTSDGSIVYGAWSLDSAQGALTMTQTDGDFNFDIKGFVSADLDHLALVEYENDGSVYSSGIVLGALISETRYDNTPPTLTVNAGVDEPILLSHGETFDLVASASDADGDDVTITWQHVGAGQFDVPTGTNATLTAPSHGHGETLMFVSASDGKQETTVRIAFEFGPGYAAGATQEEHQNAADDAELWLPEDVAEFFAEYTPFSEAGGCSPFDADGDTVETTGTQTRTHQNSGGTDVSGNPLEVGDVVQLTFDDCLRDDGSDYYYEGFIRFTINAVPFGSGDGVHSHEWVMEWSITEIDAFNGETATIVGEYAVTQSSEEYDGEVERVITRVEMREGSSPSQGLEVREGTDSSSPDAIFTFLAGSFIELEETQHDWIIRFDLSIDQAAGDGTQIGALRTFTVAPLAGNVFDGLTESASYANPTLGIARSEYTQHPERSFSGTRVVVVDVQFAEPFSSSDSDLLIYGFNNWDGVSNDFEFVAQSNYQVLDGDEFAQEGQPYALLPRTFAGDLYRYVSVNREFEASTGHIGIGGSAEIETFGLSIDSVAEEASVEIGEAILSEIILESFGGGNFSTEDFSETESYVETVTLPLEGNNILASYAGDFELSYTCSESNETLLSTGSSGVYVGLYPEVCVDYTRVDTDGDFEDDGFDGASPHYADSEVELNFFIPSEAGLNNADLAGSYGAVSYLTTMATGGGGFSNNATLVKAVTLDANGDYSDSSAATGNVFVIDRNDEASGFSIEVGEFAFAGVTEFDFEATSDGFVGGSFAFENGDSGTLDGAVSLDDGLIAVTGSFDGEGTDRGIIQHILLERNTSPVLNNTEWLVHSLVSSYDFNKLDNTWLQSGLFADDATVLSIDGSGNITWTGKEYGSLLDRGEPDGNVLFETFGDEDFTMSGSVDSSPAAGDVSFSFVETESEFTLEGFQSIGANIMVMRQKGGSTSGSSGDEAFASTGLVVMVRNTTGTEPNRPPSHGAINDPGIVTPGATAALSVSGMVDPEGESLTYDWFASVGSFSTSSGASSEENGVQVIRGEGTSVTWHAPATANPGEKALIRVVATDGERFRVAEVQISMD